MQMQILTAVLTGSLLQRRKIAMKQMIRAKLTTGWYEYTVVLLPIKIINERRAKQRTVQK